jgi:hypothetical protein
MNDILFDLERGWKNIWKLDAIWLFSLISSSYSLVLFIQNQFTSDLMKFIYCIINLIYLILFVFCHLGIYYSAYCLSIYRKANIKDVLIALKKYTAELLGCSLLVIIIFTIFILVYIITINIFIPGLNNINKYAIVPFLFSIFTAFYYFIIYEIFSNDINHNNSIVEAWMIYRRNFRKLALLGIIMALISYIFQLLIAIVITLISSHLDQGSQNNINIINPSFYFQGNIIYQILFSTISIVFIPFSASVFVMAYHKYKDVQI